MKKFVIQKREVAIYLLFCLFMVITISMKLNLHVDEISTYGLANNVNNNTIAMTINEGDTYKEADEPWINFMTVEEGHQFDYVNVWKNQEMDVHPPLYYILVHTISSFFVGKYSLWFAGSINIVFAVLTLYIVRKLTNIMLQDTWLVNIISLFFVASAGILNAVAFLRMYIMTMFWITLITYLFAKFTSEKFSGKSWAIIGSVTLLGALTHYYFLVYLFFLCIVMCIYFVVMKKWKDIGCLFATMVIAGGGAVALFPAMLRHMFGAGSEGYRGQQSIENLQQTSLVEYLERLKVFYQFINESIFGGLLNYFVVFGTFMVLVAWISNTFGIEDKEKHSCTQVVKWAILIVPSVCYFLLISKMAVYLTERYQSPIYAVLIIWCISLIYVAIKKIAQNYRVIVSVLLTVILVNSWNLSTWENLQKSSENILDIAEKYSGNDCLYIYDEIWKVKQSYYEIEKYDTVTFINYTNLDLLDGLVCTGNPEIIVYITTACDSQKVLDTIMAKSPLLNTSEELGSWGYTTVYRLYGQDLDIKRYKIYDYNRKKMLGATGTESRDNVCLVNEDTEIKSIIMKNVAFGNLYCNGLALDISGAVYKTGTNIQLFNANDSDAQKWRLQQNADGSYIIFSVKENLVLAHDDSGNVLLSEYAVDNKNQMWWFESCE